MGVVLNGFRPNLSMAGITVDLNDTNYFLLRASCSNNTYDSFATADGTKYVVPAGKTLVIMACNVSGEGATAAVKLGYGTASVNNSVAAPAGSTSLHNSSSFAGPSAQGAFPFQTIMNYSVAQNLYPYMFSSAASAANGVFLCKLV